MLIGRRLNDYQANKLTHFVHWDAYTQGGFAIMPYVPAPVIEKLGVRDENDTTVIFYHCISWVHISRQTYYSSPFKRS